MKNKLKRQRKQELQTIDKGCNDLEKYNGKTGPFRKLLS